MADGGGMTVDRLQIEIEASTQKATDGINKQIEALNRLKSATNGFGNPTHKISVNSKDVDNATARVSKLSEALAALKRIAMYRLLRTVIKEIGQAFKEGLENAYEYSKLVGGELAPALDRIATASAQMKNQMGAALGGLIQMLEPLLVELIHLVTKLAQAFTWLFAVLSGSDTYLVANEVATSWKEADKAAKAYKKTLLGIDEINRLNDPNSGGGKTTPNYGGMFHEEPVNFKLPDITQWVAPLLDSINMGLQAVAELVSSLLAIPSPGVVVDILLHGRNAFNEAWRTDFAPVLEGSPYTVQIGVGLIGNPSSMLQTVRDAIYSLVNPSPYIVTVGTEVESPAPALEGITTSFETETGKQANIFQTAYQKIKDALDSWQEKYAETKESIAKSHDSINEKIDNAMRTAYEKVSGFIEKARDTVNEWAPKIASKITTVFLDIATNMNPGLSNAKQAISDFLTKAYGNFTSWGEAISGLFSSIWEKINSVIDGVKNWYNKAKESAVWKFFFGEAKEGTIPSITTTVPIAPTIPVFVPAFASGGFVDSGDLFLAREAGPELVGTIGGQTAVANNGQIVEGISEGVAYANSGVIGAINQLIAVVQQIDPSVELDGLTVSRQLHKYNRQVNGEYGSPLAVEVGAV